MSAGVAFIVYIGVVFVLMAALLLAGRWQLKRARRRRGRRA